jgi:transcriptional regulator GlxA family with amidase domain
MQHVAILALDGVLDSALSVTLDVLGAANRVAQAAGAAPVFAPRVLGPRRGTVRCGSGYTRAVDAAFESRAHCDVVVVPGLDAPRPAEIDALLASDTAARARRYAQRAHARGALVLASCTSAFLLARAGLLDGGSATTSWYLAPHFRGCFPAVDLQEDAMVVRSGRVVTAGAALSHVDLMLWLVRHVAGPSLGDRCARFLVIDDRPSQARYVALEYLGTRSDEVRQAERFLRKNIERPIALAEIARAARCSPRTIARRFEETLGMTPLRFLRRLRVERAQHLLETTRSSVDEIAARVGYADPIALRRLLQKELGRGAREIRAGRGHGLAGRR